MERRFTHLLREINVAMRGALRDALTELDLTTQQLSVLHWIDANPGSSSAELARRAQVTPQTMHRLVSDLGRRELLSFQRRPGHGRILDTSLTDQGRNHLAAAEGQVNQVEDRMTAGLNKQQRQQLYDLLEHCIAAFDTPPDDGAASSGHHTS